MAKRKPAGHRYWAPYGRKVAGTHSGDIMSIQARSRLMARIGSRNTTPELQMAKVLRSLGLRFDQHCVDLPGSPDFAFRRWRVAVFVDGSFWHGYRFPLWQHKLSEKWQTKIAANRARDRRNFAKLRRAGWRVVRIWEHQIERDLEKCRKRVLEALRQCRSYQQMN